MGRELKIESDRAYELASALADKHGKSVTAIVEEALAAYHAAMEQPSERMEHWLSLLEEDWKHLNGSDFKVEDLYDPETGLPA